jgi:protein-tyrosine phosphatase
MIRLYSNEETFDLSVDLDWITQQLACGGQIGSAAAMADLKRQGITDILNLNLVDDTELAEPYGIRVLHNHFPDDLLPKSVAVIERGVNFAKHALRRKGSRLYIHCAAGFHRAPMMTLAVLASDGWSLRDAQRHIQRCRPVASFPAVYLRSVEQCLRECHGGETWRNR